MTDVASTDGFTEGSHLRLTLSNDRSALEKARRDVTDLLRPHAPSPKLMFDVELVLEESLMNVIWHAFPDRLAHAIQLNVQVEADDIVMRFEDHGIPFDPLAAPTPVLPTSIDAAVPGGLGLMLVRNCARSVEYQRVGGSNLLTVRVARH